MLPNAVGLSWKLPSVLEEHGTVRQCQPTSATSTSQIDIIQLLHAATADLIFLLMEHQMERVSTAISHWSSPYIDHDEQLVLTIYTQYILTHTEHQTTAGIQLVIIQLVVTRLAAMDTVGADLIFLLMEHQIARVSTTISYWSSPYIHHIF